MRPFTWPAVTAAAVMFACLAPASLAAQPAPAPKLPPQAQAQAQPAPAPKLAPTAQPLTRGAVPGQRQRVYFITHVNPDCTSAGSVIPRVTSVPGHGTVEFAPGDEFPNFQPSNVRVKCNDQRVPGIGVFYTSEPDFNGVDEFTLTYVSPEGFRNVLMFQVSVQ